MSINITKLVAQLLVGLDARQKAVVEGRYGLKNGNPKTLAEIGDGMGVTRERVRQIEEVALKAIRPVVKKEEVQQFLNLAKSHLKNVGGLRRESLMLQDLKLMVADGNAPQFSNKIHFILDVSGEVKYTQEDNGVFGFWYLSEEDRRKSSSFISKLMKFMESKRDTTVSHENIDKVFQEVIKPHNLKDLVALNYISSSKHFHVNSFGDFGLSAWPEINPRTVRDWSYLVLKKHSKPLHFGAVADMINKVRKNSEKVAHMQTVHNELIKDPRFVLVGRGMYALKEFGVMPGTAREVMARILKDNGPLDADQLLKLVLSERLLKKNTVLINLRNRKHFTRMEDGRYTVNFA